MVPSPQHVKVVVTQGAGGHGLIRLPHRRECVIVGGICERGLLLRGRLLYVLIDSDQPLILRRGQGGKRPGSERGKVCVC